MKNSEIHNGLPQKEIRDFLAMSMVKSYEDDGNNKKDYFALSNTNDGFEKAIAIAKADIKFLEKYVENLSNKRAITRLIELNGWQEHDVSDDTIKDMDYRYHMGFIGTEDEFIKLIDTINKDK